MNREPDAFCPEIRRLPVKDGFSEKKKTMEIWEKGKSRKGKAKFSGSGRREKRRRRFLIGSLLIELNNNNGGTEKKGKKKSGGVIKEEKEARPGEAHRKDKSSLTVS